MFSIFNKDRRSIINFATVLILLIVCVIIWGKTRSYEFVWDDSYFIVSNTALRSWKMIPNYFTDMSTMAGNGLSKVFVVYRPIRNISYLLDFKIAGLQPGWWHIHNVLLHLFNSILVYLVAKRIFKKGWLPPLTAALIFLVHPVQTETVAWIKCRDDLLAAAFSLLFILYWLIRRKQQFNKWDNVIFCLLYMSACMSKVQAIVIPSMTIAIDFFTPTQYHNHDSENVNKPDFIKSILLQWKTITCLAITGFGYLIIRSSVIGKISQTDYLAGNFVSTMLTMTRAGINYLVLFIFPMHQTADYCGMSPSKSIPGITEIACSTCLILIIAALFILRRRFPRACLATTWIILALLPISNIIPTMQYMAERFLYLPMVGFSLFAASVINYIQKRHPTVALCILLLVTVTYSITTSSRVAIWENNLTLFTQTVNDTPEEAMRPRANKLLALIDKGKYQEAIPVAEKLCRYSFSENSKVSAKTSAQYAASLGFSKLMIGEKAEGLKWIEKSVAVDPTYVQPYIYLGVIAGMDGKHEKAMEIFIQAIEIDPLKTEAHFNLAVAREKQGLLDKAESSYRKSIELGHKSQEAHKTLAALLWSRKRYKDAADVYADALEIWPNDDELNYWFKRAINE